MGKTVKLNRLSGWWDNPRFYVVLFSILLSIIVASWLRLLVESDQTYFIRLEQVYGYIAVFFLYSVLLISAVTRVVGNTSLFFRTAIFLRRPIGVSVFYFAALHGVIALFGQLDGFMSLNNLPDLFLYALAIGGLAIIILFLMSLTSFDGVIRYMGAQKWKLLHRLVYVASILVLVHIWMIGTHINQGFMQIIFLLALGILFAFESIRIVGVISSRIEFLNRSDYRFILILFIAGLFFTSILIGSLVIEQFHADNHQTKRVRMQE